jgi:hypothetical protein
MKNRLTATLFSLSLTLPCTVIGSASPNADVALVTVLQGNVRFKSKEGNVRPASAYMRIRHGDAIQLPKNSTIRLSYTSTPRHEIWTGPASFVATLSGGELLNGRKAVVMPLPSSVPVKLSRVTELMNTSHMGGSVVRSVKPPVPATREDIAAAISVYESMRANTTLTDVTPELYLYAIFLDNEMYEDLKVVAKDMLIRQPDNAEVRTLADAAMEPRP